MDFEFVTDFVSDFVSDFGFVTDFVMDFAFVTDFVSDFGFSDFGFRICPKNKVKKKCVTCHGILSVLHG